jgi:predicted ATP-grasp superfamily ATP-dependent carboligase
MQTATSITAPFLIVAVTGRALAASASRAGHRAIVLDYFADRDTSAFAVECRSVAAVGALRFDRRALVASVQAATSRCAGLVYGSGFEGCPGLLSRLIQGIRLYGNAPAVVAAVRDPLRFFGLLDRLAIRHPKVRLAAPRDRAGWLVKQAGGSGGAHVRPAGRRPLRPGGYYQRWLPGRALSALFLADGRRACIVGFNEQWPARARPTQPFLYGGAIGGISLPSKVERDIRPKLDALVAATGLVGLNGLDFLLHEGQWFALEVNPRPTATMELYDPDYPRGLFDWHLRACNGELPDHPATPRAIRAHAVVYAASSGRISAAFEPPEWCRDVPHPGAGFAPGEPVCTVHAAASDADRAAILLCRRRTQLERLLREAAA